MKGKHFVVSLSIGCKRLNCERCVYTHVHFARDAIFVLEHLVGILMQTRHKEAMCVCVYVHVMKADRKKKK